MHLKGIGSQYHWEFLKEGSAQDPNLLYAYMIRDAITRPEDLDLLA